MPGICGVDWPGLNWGEVGLGEEHHAGDAAGSGELMDHGGQDWMEVERVDDVGEQTVDRGG